MRLRFSTLGSCLCLVALALFCVGCGSSESDDKKEKDKSSKTDDKGSDEKGADDNGADDQGTDDQGSDDKASDDKGNDDNGSGGAAANTAAGVDTDAVAANADDEQPNAAGATSTDTADDDETKSESITLTDPGPAGADDATADAGTTGQDDPASVSEKVADGTDPGTGDGTATTADPDEPVGASATADAGNTETGSVASADASDDPVGAATTVDGGATTDSGTTASDDPVGAAAPGAADAGTTEPQRLTESETPINPRSSGIGAGAPTESRLTGDWPMWGGTPGRNMVSDMKGITLDFDPEEGKRVLWTGELGSQTYGNPVVAGGKIYVGTNNGAGHRPKHPAAEDRGVMLCFDEASGELLWQLTRLKLAEGRVNDWPLQGICSVPVIEGDRLWVVTNRCELMCVDTEGFRDGENDGPYQDEEDTEELDADIVWSLDLIAEYGVFPHNLATSSPVMYEEMVYVLTSNGVDEAHKELPAPRSPSLVAVNKETGELVWENNDPRDGVLHGQWSSPALGIVNGSAQIYFPAGDGILRALNAKSGDEIWRFDLNPKESLWKLGGKGTRNAIISTPVFYENSVILGVGQDPEHGEGVGHLWRIDATKEGDISAELGEIGSPGEPNPNSGVIWHYGGLDHDGSVTGEEDGEIYRRTMSTVSVADGLVIAPDLSGRVHCIDFETGERYWEYDLLAEIWGSTMVVDGKVFLGDENGDLNVFELSKEPKLVKKILFPSSIYSTPTIANGMMYVSDRSTLYAIDVKAGSASE